MDERLSEKRAESVEERVKSLHPSATVWPPSPYYNGWRIAVRSGGADWIVIGYGQDAISAWADAASNLPKPNPLAGATGEWISVKERLPEVDISKSFHGLISNGSSVTPAWYCLSGHNMDTGEKTYRWTQDSQNRADITRVVTHWQPMRYVNKDCVCPTYEGNLGPCNWFEKGGNSRCVYCDHEESCHLDVMMRRLAELKSVASSPVEGAIRDVYEVYGSSARSRGWDFLACTSMEEALYHIESDLDALEEGEECRIVFRRYSPIQMEEVVYE